MIFRGQSGSYPELLLHVKDVKESSELNFKIVGKSYI